MSILVQKNNIQLKGCRDWLKGGEVVLLLSGPICDNEKVVG